MFLKPIKMVWDVEELNQTDLNVLMFSLRGANASCRHVGLVLFQVLQVIRIWKWEQVEIGDQWTMDYRTYHCLEMFLYHRMKSGQNYSLNTTDGL